MARRTRTNFGPPNIDTSAATAFSNVLALAMQLDAQSKEQAWRSKEALSEREWRAEEALAAREFSEAQTYRQNLMNKENLLFQNILEAQEEAASFGFNVEEPLRGLNEMFINDGLKDTVKQEKETRIQNFNNLQEMYSDVRKEIGLHKRGQNIAYDIDQNNNYIFDEDERVGLLAAEIAGGMDPEAVLPKSLVEGVRYGLGSTEGRVKGYELEKSKYELDIAKAQFEEIKARAGKEMADEYKADNILAIGTPSFQDLAVGNAIKSEWQLMEPNILDAMISNTLVTYDDPVSDQIDKEDIQYAIVPYMKKYAEDKISNPDFQAAVGLTDQDKEAKNEKYLKVINSITSNALAGMRENEAYTLRTQKDILESRTMNRAAMKQMFSDEELGTYNKATETLANVLPIVEDTGEPSEAHMEAIQENLKSAGLNWDETKIYAEYMRLRGAVDPYTIAITIQQNQDSQTLLKALGQDAFVAIMQQATAALQTTPGAPRRRVARKKKAPPGRRRMQDLPPDQLGPSTSIGQGNLDTRIKEAALLSLDIADARAERNIAQETKLLEELEFVEKQIQQLLDQGFQPGTSSLQNIKLELPR